MKLQVARAIKSFTLIVAISFVGCSRCEDCELNGGSERICEAEFDSPDQYENAIADREAQGAVCTSASGF